MTVNNIWEALVQKAVAVRDKSLAKVDVPPIPSKLPLNVTGIPAMVLTPEEVEITETHDATSLAVAIASKKYTAVTVVKAFMRRAAVAQKLVNCVTELLFDTAIERAQELDEHLEKTGKTIGPLHGVPISVKEHIGMKGLACNAGFVAWIDYIAPDDAGLLKLLYAAGAVFYVRTTEPQTLMHAATSSAIFGETVNPHNTNLTCGGSSGGEGAIIGMKASVMGVGTDIGGSIRIPAAYCGVYGHRPTTKRLPMSGLKMSMAGQESIMAVIGPLAASTRDLNLFMKSVLDLKPWKNDPALIPLPWKEEKLAKEDLIVGILYDDGWVKPAPPLLRSLKETAAKLQKSGVKVVKMDPYDHHRGFEIVVSMYFADGAKEDIEVMASTGEPSMPLTDFVLKNNPYVKRLEVEDNWALNVERDMYRTEYLAHWNSANGGNPPDVILCPAAGTPASRLNESKYWTYTCIWNILDYPAAVFPVSKVDPTIDIKEEGYKGKNADDIFIHETYDPEYFKGAPINLQVVGKPWEDEKVLAAMQIIEDALAA